MDQTPEKYQAVCNIKVTGITNLDKLTREKHGSHLEWFVAFSSAASAFGNPGQSNYAYANAFMERVVEKRHADKVPGILQV